MSDELVMDFGLEGAAELMRNMRDLASFVDGLGVPMKRFQQMLHACVGDSAALARNMMVAAHAAVALSGMANVIPQIPGGRSKPAAPKLPKPPATFWQAMKNVLGTARVNFGAQGFGLSPLIGRLIPALMKLGPMGIAAGAAAVSIGALSAAAKRAAGLLLGASKLSHIGGGTSGQSAVGMRLAGMQGIDPATFAKEAQAFQERVLGDWRSIRGATRLGLDTSHFVPGNESVDATKDYIDAIRAIVMHSDKATAERSARDLQLQDYTWMRDLTPQHKKELFAEDGTFAGMFGPQQKQNAAEYAYTMMKLNALWQEMVVKVGGPLLTGLNLVSNAMSSIANTGRVVGDILKLVYDFLTGQWGNLRKDWQTVKDDWHGLNDPDKSKSAKDRTQEEQLRQLRGINDGIRAMTPGMHGGGERARNAIPANASRVSPALNLGAFAF